MLSIRPSWWKTPWMSLGLTSRMGSCPPTDRPPYLRAENTYTQCPTWSTKEGVKTDRKRLRAIKCKWLPLFVHPVFALQTVKWNSELNQTGRQLFRWIEGGQTNYSWPAVALWSLKVFLGRVLKIFSNKLFFYYDFNIFEVFNTFFVGFFFASLPGSDEAGVGFNQVVGDVPVRQVQQCVSCGLDSLARRQATGSGGTDGHHGKLLTGATLAGRRRVPLGPSGTQQDVADHGRDIGILPLWCAVTAGHSGGRGKMNQQGDWISM